MGINWGPIGGDFILTNDGLKVIEIGPRLHGPNGSLQIFPKATGIKPFEFMVQYVAGDKPNSDFLKKKHNKVALCKVYVSNKSKIKSVRLNKSPNKLDGLFSYYIYWKPKDKTIKSNTSLSGLASVFILGDTYEDAINKLSVVDKELIIV